MASGSGLTRVLRIITRLNVGGPTRHVRLLAEGLDPERYDQVIAHGPGSSDEGVDVIEVPGRCVRIDALVRPPRPFKDALARRRILALIRSFRPDIVHTHQGKAGALGRLAAAEAGVRAIVHTYHGHTFGGYFGPLRSALVRWYERRAARVSHAIICQSPRQEQDILATLRDAAAGKTVIIPPAIPAEFLGPPRAPRAVTRAALGAPDRATVLLLPARLVPVKRPLLALALAAEIGKSLDVRLWFAGAGPLASDVRRCAAREGMADRVRMLGQVADMRSLYAAADLTLLVSAMEGTPLSLFESMAAGTAVAATGVGGVPDVLGDDGLVLDPHAGVEEWARTIVTLFADPDRIRIITARARERVAHHHTPAALVERVSALYTRLLR